jgi:hypothetical protein
MEILFYASFFLGIRASRDLSSNATERTLILPSDTQPTLDTVLEDVEENWDGV